MLSIDQHEVSKRRLRSWRTIATAAPVARHHFVPGNRQEPWPQSPATPTKAGQCAHRALEGGRSRFFGHVLRTTYAVGVCVDSSDVTAIERRERITIGRSEFGEASIIEIVVPAGRAIEKGMRTHSQSHRSAKVRHKPESRVDQPMIDTWLLWARVGEPGAPGTTAVYE